LLVLLIASIIILFAALFDLQALKIGKISVVEPIYALEIPVTALLATMIIGEYLSTGQIISIFFLLIGILFLSIRSFSQFKNFRWEKGIWYAILATISMGTVNFIFGISARQTSPLLINWFTSSFICLVSIFYLAQQNKFKEIIDNFKKNKKLILSVSIIDNLAWIAYAYSTVYIPIAVATSISEGYIALAAGLGLIFNKEKLKNHQIIGLIIAVVSVITLAKITR
jgi:drug/metabolite transporter (DMT)-like permease